ncbi:protein IQ-DOMAIN 14-like isoform X2 [Camellia sinensis]|uniref:protein IQ-DOMAIN 14-like isoform X2 n=1 Tax=Camellia sinensis TaxID=4442 RepID=UPI001035E3AB|nr:protein IQ-DOMAIN 14-like isoform X2 [Camellia sinensis]
MGKKGSWFAAIKRVFVPNSKDKVVNGSDKKNSTKEKKGKGILRDGETKSFIPLFREPSSIEKILGEADQQIYVTSAPTPAADQPETPPLVLDSAASPRATSPTAASPRATSSTAASLRASSPTAVSAPATSSPTAVSAPATSSPTAVSAPATSSPTAVSAPATSSPTAVSAPATSSPTAASPQATSPSASSRAVHHRKEVTYRPEPTLKYQHLSAIRIQTAYRGYMARRSFTALRGLVRLQGAVRAQNVERQTINAMKMMQLLVRVQTQIQSRRTQMLENQAIQRRQACKNDKDLDSSLGKWTATQLLKGNPKSAPTWAMDIRSGGFPWWWNWLERHHLPPANPSNTQTTKSFLPTPPRPTLMSETKPSPQPATSNYKQDNITSGLDRLELLTPTSTRSAVPAKKYLKPRSSVAADSASDVPLRDDDSLMSCPPFSVPNYMTPTVSAKAKVRTNSNPNRFPGTLSGDSKSKRRFSFPLTPNIGSFKWNKGSTKDSTSQRVSEKDQSLQSVGDLSIDSTVSMPAAVGRKPFNRFV